MTWNSLYVSDLGDLFRGHQSKIAPESSIIVLTNINEVDSDEFELHMKILNFLPLTYNDMYVPTEWEGHKIDLT